MSEKKIKIYGLLKDEPLSKFLHLASLIKTIFDNTHISSCVLTSDNGVVLYARLCSENVIGVCFERGVKE
jgi:hypothetical protein